jgi:hypothetical protein
MLYDRHGRQVAPTLPAAAITTSSSALSSPPNGDFDLESSVPFYSDYDQGSISKEELVAALSRAESAWRAGADRFPFLPLAALLSVKIDQGPGTALFVPSGWHHMVVNATDALSFNHNWLNGYNLRWGVALLRSECEGAAALIDDLR